MTEASASASSRAVEGYALAARGVHKRFGGTHALADAHLLLRPGTINSLLGGNGSGKSTMLKCLAGVYRADEGTVTIRGRSMPAADIAPAIAHEAGLRVVHQDLGLFDQISIAENFAFESGFPTGPGGKIGWRRLHRRVAELLEQYGVEARPQDAVGSLRPAQKTLVAIARALQDQADENFVLLLDEPTASLPRHESDALLEALRERAAAGQTIAFVSHRLQEVREVADEITVYRDGTVAGTLAGDASEEAIVALIAGPAHLERVPTAARVRRASTGTPILEAKGVSAGPLHELDLSVDQGEIVGVAGLLGSGRSTLLDVIFGARTPTDGQVVLGGKAVRPGAITASMRHGVAHVPENRLRDAAFSAMTVRENASASVVGRYWSGWMRSGRERAATRTLIEQFNVKTSSTESPILSLSGGNQQKVMLGRWLQRDPRLLLLDEPTQGVDVVAREEIYRSIREAADRGCGVLIASSDHEELAALCDRVVVLADGQAAATLVGGEITPELLTQLTQSARHALETTS